MTYFPLQPRYFIYTDSLGDPLDNGYIYIGDANLDPTLYPAKASWDQAGLYPIIFPVRTRNGYPIRNGNIAQIFLALEDNFEYSALIQDEDEATVFSSATGLSGYFPASSGGDAATLGGELPSYYATDSLVVHLAGAETVTGPKTFNADITLGTGVQIDFFDEVGDKIYLYQNAFGIGIEADNLTNWSSLDFRWRTGGTSVSTGTEVMALDSSGNLAVTGSISDAVGTVMHLAGAETITGSKSFSSSVTLTGSSALTFGDGTNDPGNLSVKLGSSYAASWSKAFYILNSSGTRISGIGSYGSSQTYSYSFIGWGSSPWLTANSLSISDSYITYKDNTVWHAGNDGSGSGLDADTVDGIEGSNIAKLDAQNIFTTYQTIETTSPVFRLRETDTTTHGFLNQDGGNFYIQASSTSYTGSGNIRFSGANSVDIASFTVRHSGAWQDIWHAGNLGAGANGTLQLPSLASDPASGEAAGQIYYNTTSNLVRFYNGSAWGDI